MNKCETCKFYNKTLCIKLGVVALPGDYACTVYEENGMLNDTVNHPSHYTDGGIETIDFIEAKKLNYHLGNAVKYISRAGKKDVVKTKEDLEKAIWYIKRYIKKLEEQK